MMVLSLGQLLYFTLFMVNGLAILNEERFLARVGWGKVEPTFGGDPNQSIKAKLINLISAVRTLLRIPLIVLNLLVIVYELLLG
ncbi:Yos1-like protein [Basidiobolus meristosporus CBS 931.73]|uniref:Yos1-like protein n=1 Tax=Basidiobolus meristosporus CBS 931.73 TaxID=1314790 RepID=A0A1Y1XSU5_9FUNG|nr:Yos1-like protein [Basidiobolus meristosporus CBS 931.73]|eukprot:ORX88810.1 Yos1-like protein [Basidiobolus meristosporus CBS 931.73]